MNKLLVQSIVLSDDNNMYHSQKQTDCEINSKVALLGKSQLISGQEMTFTFYSCSCDSLLCTQNKPLHLIYCIIVLFAKTLIIQSLRTIFVSFANLSTLHLICHSFANLSCNGLGLQLSMTKKNWNLYLSLCLCHYLKALTYPKYLSAGHLTPT